MFERYTEKARRVIFFARYEALQYGSQVISPEHILLGLMREDKTLSARFFPFRNSLSVEAVRREVEERITFKERIPQSAELHLSNETKRILALAAEESRKLKNRHIGPEHLLLGILREEKSIAAEILFQYGLRLQDVRDEIARQSGFSDLSVADEGFAVSGFSAVFCGFCGRSQRRISPRLLPAATRSGPTKLTAEIQSASQGRE